MLANQLGDEEVLLSIERDFIPLFIEVSQSEVLSAGEIVLSRVLSLFPSLVLSLVFVLTMILNLFHKQWQK